METKKEKTIELHFIGGNSGQKLVNMLMHKADMFEEGKHFAEVSMLTVKGNPDMKKLCQRLANVYEQSGEYAVFIGVKSINGKKPKKANVWFQKGVQTISMVNKGTLSWMRFSDILTALGYAVKTDERMRVTDIS